MIFAHKIGKKLFSVKDFLKPFKTSKKAELQEYTIGLIIKILFTMTVIITTWMIVFQGFEAKEFSKQLDADTIAPLLLYNQEIVYVDSNTDRIYPGWIDTWKLNHIDFQDKFDNSMKVYGDIDYLSIAFTLYDDSDNSDIVKEFYYNKEEYSRNKIMVDGGLTKGAGGYKNFTKVYPVYYDDSKEPGFLKMNMIFPN